MGLPDRMDMHHAEGVLRLEVSLLDAPTFRSLADGGTKVTSHWSSGVKTVYGDVGSLRWMCSQTILLFSMFSQTAVNPRCRRAYQFLLGLTIRRRFTGYLS